MQYRFGVEEELFLADASTRGTPARPLEGFHRAAQAMLPDVERELLVAQVEIASPPLESFAQARQVLARARRNLAALARQHGLLLLASGTQPCARWSAQDYTSKPRYERLLGEMGMLARRDVVCGMHVHVEVPQPVDRVVLMNALVPALPLLLALSASSPFWQGQSTGLAAYRLSVWGEMPRTGLPPLFADTAEYDRYVRLMTETDAIGDPGSLWWSLRPSHHAPTLELRIADSCTRLDDGLAIAALFRCLVRRAVRRPDRHETPAGLGRALVEENLWRAQRHGVRASFIDETSAGLVPCERQLSALLDAVAEDAEALGCEAELERARVIARDGTSADRQVALAADGATLPDVVDWIAAETTT